MRIAELFSHRSAVLRYGTIITTAFSLSVFSAMPAFSQAIGWGTPQRDSSTPIGGQSGKTGLGVANFNNALWAAYTGTSIVDSQGDAYVYVASNSTGGVAFGNKTQVTVSGGQTVAANSNPALAVFQNKLYLAYNDGYGQAHFVSSSDGVNWGVSITACGSNVDSSPSLAVFNGYLYMGLRYAPSHSLMFCRIASDNSTSTSVYSQYSLNYNPSLAVYNGTLFAATEDYANTHSIDVYTSPDGATFTLSLGAANDQTSTAPSLAVHNNTLYLGFRTNDSNNKFEYKYTTDGANWTTAPDPHWAIGGPPALVNASTLTGSPYNGQMFMIFSSNTSAPNYLCDNHGN